MDSRTACTVYCVCVCYFALCLQDSLPALACASFFLFQLPRVEEIKTSLRGMKYTIRDFAVPTFIFEIPIRPGGSDFPSAKSIFSNLKNLAAGQFENLSGTCDCHA